MLENMRLPQFTVKRRTDSEFHLFLKGEKDKHSFIIGRDVLQQIGLDILNSKNVFAWDRIPKDHWNSKEIKGFWATHKKTDEEVQVAEICQEEYAKADLREVVSGLEHLDKKEKYKFYPCYKNTKRHLSEPEGSGW